MSEDLWAYFAAEVPKPDWAERAAVIDYLTGYERQLEAPGILRRGARARSWWTPVIAAMLRHTTPPLI
jgi:hypothetical protein